MGGQAGEYPHARPQDVPVGGTQFHAVDGDFAGGQRVAARAAAAVVRESRWTRCSVFAAVFVVVLAVHEVSPVRQCSDSRWALHKAMSILTEGNTDLDEYPIILKAENYYAIQTVNGHLYDLFPIGVSIAALPFVAADDLWFRLVRHHGFAEELRRRCGSGEQKLIAGVFVALTAAILYLIALDRLGTSWRALVPVFVFAFCTSAWSSASRGLWQHAPSMLMLTTTLYLFVLAEKKPKLIQYAGAFLAFSYVVRPTNSIPIVVLTLLVLLLHRRYFLQYLAWGAAVAVPFFAFNYSVFGTLIPFYYMPGRLEGHSRFWEALAGNLISPSRGLFVFSPVLALSLLGVGIKMKQRRIDALDVSLLTIVVLHWIVISSYPPWWAGYSYGPRLFTDMMPYFAYLLIPVVEKLFRPVTGRTAALASLIVVLAAVSFFAHFRGAFRNKTMSWNVTPVNVNAHPERIWDYRDPQFLR